jgi:lysozyme family protein
MASKSSHASPGHRRPQGYKQDPDISIAEPQGLLIDLEAMAAAEFEQFDNDFEPPNLIKDEDIETSLYLEPAPRYDNLFREYTALWSEMAVQRSRLPQVDGIVDRIVANRQRYQVVEQSTGVPWYVTAAIHNLEASLSFQSHLHNGDPLSERTVRIPRGRPLHGQPQFAWETSAHDALQHKGLAGNRDWSVQRIAYVLEGYSGWGYRLYHPEVKTPYLWSFSNHYDRGKYLADGYWSSSTVSEQCGAMVLLYRLEQRGFIRLRPAMLNGAEGPNEEDGQRPVNEDLGTFTPLRKTSVLDRYPDLVRYLDEYSPRISSGEEVSLRGERFLIVTQAGQRDGGQIAFRIEDFRTLVPVLSDTIVDLGQIDKDAPDPGVSTGCGTSTDHDHRTVYNYMLSQVDRFSSQDGPDGGNLACVWAVRHIVKNALGRWITRTDGTAAFAEELKACFGVPTFNENEVPAGGLIISPSRTIPGEPRRRVGHIGILGEPNQGDRLIYSNTSAYALWQQNFTLSEWINVYRHGKRLKVLFFPLPRRS